MLTFYTHPQSRGRIVRWMLEEIGIPYEQHLLEYGTSMKAPAYLAINPMGKVPAILHQTNQGSVVVTECAAICAYLADAFPHAHLAPPLTQRASYYRWFFFSAGAVEAAITDRARQITPTPQQQAMVGYGSLEQVVSTLEQAVSAHTWLTGDTFTAADVYVGAQIDFGLQFGLLPATTPLQAYVDKLRARPAYQKAKAMDAALLAERASTPNNKT